MQLALAPDSETGRRAGGTFMNNVKTLSDAGLVRPEMLTDQDKKVLEALTPDEVSALLRVKTKLGDDMIKQNWQQPKFI